MKTFPKPLTAEEERSYLEQYREGSEEAKAVLIERNLRLVAHVVKKYQYTDYETEDLLSVGTIGLIKAVNTFKADRGSRLATYAAKCVENAILPSRRQTCACFFIRLMAGSGRMRSLRPEGLPSGWESL